MASPFPGMDPYIEARGLWGDFHSALIGEIDRALAAALPERYVLRSGKRSYTVLSGSEEDETPRVCPDVNVMDAREADPSSDGPLSLRAFIEMEFRETFLGIYRTEPKRRLVTSIEVLSPSNKYLRSLGRRNYLRKRQALLLGAANLVEIDLLRGGTRMPMLDPWPNTPYTLLVARRRSAPSCRVWPAHFQRPLPPLPVPLASPDPDIILDLQPLLAAVYARSRYQRDIDYSQPLQPPLSAAEAEWWQRLRQGQPAPPAEPGPAT